MSTSLFSQNWYRVASLKPQLKRHANIHRQIYRGEVWYVLQDDMSDKYSRVSPEAMAVISLMDGSLSMQEIWQRACDQLSEDLPTQDELISLLGRLYQFNLMRTDNVPDIFDLDRRFHRDKRARLLQYIKSPMSLKLPLLDPERFLNSTQKLAGCIFSPLGLCVWLVTVVAALLNVGVHWDELTQNFSDQAFSLGNFIGLALIYPVVKLIHELGHAYAMKRWGAQVHELGLMFLVFIPVPYVEASGSLSFRSKYQRMLVAGAGILVEVFLAACAVLLWVQAEPGLFRAMLFNVMLIGGVSTVLFNGNPLLRFDAYYVLSDFLELPNLGLRSNQYLGFWLRRYVLQIKDEQTPSNSWSESAWLFFYSIASFIYRVIVMVAIALFVATNFFIVGVLLALWSIYNALVLPSAKVIAYLFRDYLMKRYRVRVVAALVATACSLLVVLSLPLPRYTVAQGVFWAPEQAQVISGTECVVAQVNVQSEQRVNQGDVLATCVSLETLTDEKVATLRLAELNSRLLNAIAQDPIEAKIIRDEIAHTETELMLAQKMVAAMNIEAPRSGTVFLEQAQDLPGRFIQRGSYLGYVQTDDAATVRVLVSQDDIYLVRQDVRNLTARRAGNLQLEMSANIVQEVPAGSRQLPSLALTISGGGDVVLDTTASDQALALDHWFQFDIALPDEHEPRIGEKVYVRFEHTPQSLAQRLYIAVRRVFLRQFAL